MALKIYPPIIDNSLSTFGPNTLKIHFYFQDNHVKSTHVLVRCLDIHTQVVLQEYCLCESYLSGLAPDQYECVINLTTNNSQLKQDILVDIIALAPTVDINTIEDWAAWLVNPDYLDQHSLASTKERKLYLTQLPTTTIAIAAKESSEYQEIFDTVETNYFDLVFKGEVSNLISVFILFIVGFILTLIDNIFISQMIYIVYALGYIIVFVFIMCKKMCTNEITLLIKKMVDNVDKSIEKLNEDEKKDLKLLLQSLTQHINLNMKKEI